MAEIFDFREFRDGDIALTLNLGVDRILLVTYIFFILTLDAIQHQYLCLYIYSPKSKPWFLYQ